MDKNIQLKHFEIPDIERVLWLDPIDALIACASTQNISHVMEIGVYKGGWALTTLLNSNSHKVYGIDPYPGLESIHSDLKSHIIKLQLASRFFLFDSKTEFLNKNSNLLNSFSIIHIDGEHTESAVQSDLEFAIKLLDENGIIIVDDFFDRRFPGVSSALLFFMKAYDFRIYLITDHKAYLCKSSIHENMFNKNLTLLTEFGLNFSTGFPKGAFSENYDQPNSILGFNNILLRTSQNIGKVRSYHSPSINKKIINILKLVTPLILVKVAKFFINKSKVIIHKTYVVFQNHI
jgi:hypothetical protein